ncbi:hypothetical protein, partial [Erwinia amylovora]|uniref:hypothetical protein n=1 Tax=Erwinia amylovora TaxID=552 RepID=UPI00196B8665
PHRAAGTAYAKNVGNTAGESRPAHDAATKIKTGKRGWLAHIIVCLYFQPAPGSRGRGPKKKKNPFIKKKKILSLKPQRVLWGVFNNHLF